MARPPLYDTSLFGDGKLTRFRLNIPHAFYADAKTRQVSSIDGYGPVNPIFPSGLTINSGFTYTNGTEQSGYTLFTDGTGYAYWDLGPTQGVTGITATDGLSSQTTSNVTTIINIDKGSSQNIFKNILVDSTIQFSANSNSDSLNFSGINLTITSAGTNTLVFSAGTGGGGGSGTTDFSAVSINSVTQFTSSSDKTINFSGINISITSAATNTLVFSAGTGGSGGTTVTGGTYSAGTLTLDNSTGGTVSVTGFPATTSFGVTVDGSGGVITTGQKGYIRIPYGFTITSWTLIGSPSGSITFDIWRTNGAIPTVANTIIGGGGTKPNLSSGTYATSSTLTNWTITGATGDVIGWNVDSCTTTTTATLQLFVTRTQ
jgi:hypothetical protein